MSTEIRNRQSDLVDENILNTYITVVGAGAIGSFTVLALAKCGFNRIEVFDNDTVEEHNIPNQFYPLDSIGAHKVRVLRDMVKRFTGVEMHAVMSRFNKDTTAVGGIVISAVDNMESRKIIYNKHKGFPSSRGLIDGRMGGNQLEVYTCDMTDKKSKSFYKKTLWTDEETADVPCTQRAVIYNVLTISSWIVNQVRLLLSKKHFQRELILDLENMILIGGGLDEYKTKSTD